MFAGECVEEEVEEKPKKTFMDQFLVGARKTDQSTTKPQASPKKTKQETKPEVSATDFFGGGTIHRVERKVQTPVQKVGMC